MAKYRDQYGIIHDVYYLDDFLYARCSYDYRIWYNAWKKYDDVYIWDRSDSVQKEVEYWTNVFNSLPNC